MEGRELIMRWKSSPPTRSVEAQARLSFPHSNSTIEGFCLAAGIYSHRYFCFLSLLFLFSLSFFPAGATRHRPAQREKKLSTETLSGSYGIGRAN